MTARVAIRSPAALRRRFLRRCQALPTTATAHVQPLFEASLRECGRPDVIRTDNGPPFASTGAGGRTPLSLWWLQLDIWPDRLDAGQPQQNGRHERLHGTRKRDACPPPARSLPAQQHAFDQFRRIDNEVRPPDALGQVPPATVSAPSPRPFPDRLPQLTSPAADGVRWVRPNGAIRWRNGAISLSQTLTGAPVGLCQIGDDLWAVPVGPRVLGQFRDGATKLSLGGGPRPGAATEAGAATD